MNEFIKLAALEMENSRDVIKTASVIRLLKNKLLSLFDSEKAGKISKMLDTTSTIKPKLVETYKLIKKVENAINDLDIDDYNATIEELKTKVNELDKTISGLNVFLPDLEEKEEGKEDNKEPIKKEKKEDSPKEEEAKKESTEDKTLSKPEREPPPYVSPGTKREREEKYPIGKESYDDVHTLSELKITANDIILPTDTEMVFKSSWAYIVRPPSDPVESKYLLLEQDKVTLDMIKQTFYNKIPYMDIERITGRELNAVDHPRFGKKGKQKPGLLEVIIKSDKYQLPSPADNWHMLMVFYLVDARKAVNDPFKFKLYRQYVVNATDDTTGKTYVGKEKKVKK